MKVYVTRKQLKKIKTNKILFNNKLIDKYYKDSSFGVALPLESYINYDKNKIKILMGSDTAKGVFTSIEISCSWNKLPLNEMELELPDNLYKLFKTNRAMFKVILKDHILKEFSDRKIEKNEKIIKNGG